MTAQYHFETMEDKRENTHPGRVRALLARRQAQNEIRMQREIEIKRRAAKQLRTIIVNLEREVVNLDDSIGSELALASIRDPSHFAYPISVRTMQARRENLRTTIAALSDQLTTFSVHDIENVVTYPGHTWREPVASPSGEHEGANKLRAKK
jgi:hypothetical protein